MVKTSHPFSQRHPRMNFMGKKNVPWTAPPRNASDRPRRISMDATWG